MLSVYLIYLGDVRLTLALSFAVAAWLCFAHAWRLAFWWSVIIAMTFAAVAVSKVIFLGWGVHVAVLQYKAASGHAAGVTAVLPIVLFLASCAASNAWRTLAFFSGILISVAVVIALVQHREHTASEACAGWVIGLCACLSTYVCLRRTHIHIARRQVVAVTATSLIIAFCMQHVPVGWWMVKTALALTGRSQVHAWE
jgi:hypothetical protein